MIRACCRGNKCGYIGKDYGLVWMKKGKDKDIPRKRETYSPEKQFCLGSEAVVHRISTYGN